MICFTHTVSLLLARYTRSPSTRGAGCGLALGRTGARVTSGGAICLASGVLRHERRGQTDDSQTGAGDRRDGLPSAPG